MIERESCRKLSLFMKPFTSQASVPYTSEHPSSLPLRSSAVDIKGKRTDTCTWPCLERSSAPRIVILFIPGNPGQSNMQLGSWKKK
jgi:hypothetical protein